MSHVTQAVLSRNLAAWRKVFGVPPVCRVERNGAIELRPDAPAMSEREESPLSPLQEWKARHGAK